MSARIGAGILPLLTRRRLAGWEKLSLGMFLGWGIAGPALLGLALTRLFYPAVIIPCIVLMLGASCAAWTPRIFLAEGIKPLKELHPIGGIFLASAVLAFLYMGIPRLLVPDTSIDTLTYHLGVPWQFLQVHGVQLDHVYSAFKFPLPMDICLTIPLILKDDRLGQWTAFSAFLAMSLYSIGFFLRRGEKEGAWLGPMLMLSTAQLWLLASCKNDTAAAGFLALGALLTLSRSWSVGSVFLGLSVSAKPLAIPLVGLWCLFRLPPRRSISAVMLALAIPSLPWLMKSYAATGSIFPFADGPTRFFSYVETRGMGLAELPLGWATRLFEQNSIIFLLLPGLFFWGSTRLLVLACVIGQLLIAKFHGEPRYLMASIWIISLLTVLDLPRLKGKLKVAAIGLLALAALGRIVAYSIDFGGGWKDVPLSVKEYRRRHLTTYQEMLGILEGLGHKRVMTVGDYRAYPIPGRVVFGGVLAESPLIWKMVNESTDVSGLARKFRQLGVDVVCHNYVTSLLVGFNYKSVPWDERMAVLYAEYLKRYQTRLGGTAGNDHFNGGFYVYRNHIAPLEEIHKQIWFVPGAETIFTEAYGFERDKEAWQALQAAESVLKLLPDVGAAWNLIGRYHLLNRDPKKAYKYFKPFISQGMIDNGNLQDFAIACRKLGKLDEAESVLQVSKDFFPSYRDFSYVELVTIYVARAEGRLQEGDREGAAAMIEKAEGYLEMISRDYEHKDSVNRIKTKMDLIRRYL